MSIVDFSRGELAPTMRYRKDLEVYHKGVETLERFLPTPRGGLVRGPGCQVLEILPPSDHAPAVRMFSLGSTGMDYDIPKVGSSDVLVIFLAGYDEAKGPNHADNIPFIVTYDTQFRTHDIPKDKEMDILLSFTEYGKIAFEDDIVAYWVNTPDGNPSFYQRIWNYDPTDGFSFPEISFDDTREVRVAQVENNIYVTAKTQIYRLFWDKDKVCPVWDAGVTYNERSVVMRTVDTVSGPATYYFECTEKNIGFDPAGVSGPPLWRAVYIPFMSWEIVSPRVGYELLKGIGTEGDEFRWVSNATWASSTAYMKGDVVRIVNAAYECIGKHTTGDITGKTPIEGDWATSWKALSDLTGKTSETISDDDGIYKRSSYAFREETVPREMVVHHNRLIFAGSSIRPSTMHGSEVYHYMNFGTGINDDEPWIVTLSGDRVGRILWMSVTDQLYIGTSGGIFALNGVLTPTSFQLRKVTNHSTSEIHAVAAAGSIIFFHKDKQTMREVQYADQAENYHAMDLTVFSDHLFEEFLAVKMVVVNDPSIVIWILRSDGTLVSLSYEATVGMYAFARHELYGFIYDIVAGRGGELYAITILENTDVRQLIRIGHKDITDGAYTLKDVHLDGLTSFVNIDTANEFAINILNKDMHDWYVSNGITSLSDMFGWILPVNASAQVPKIGGLLYQCGLGYLDEVSLIDLSDNDLVGQVPIEMTNSMSKGTNASLDLSGNLGITDWMITKIPASWTNINLSNTGLSLAYVEEVIDSILASLVDAPRAGTVNFSTTAKTRKLSADDTLGKAVTLLGEGWTVIIDNEAGWSNEYVNFNGNGNDAGDTPAAMPWLFMEEKLLPGGNTLVKADHIFNGWSDGPDNSPEHNSGYPYKKDIEGSVTLYATWLPSNKIQYQANSGASAPVDSNTYNPGNIVTVASGVPVRSGYNFLGWTLDQAGMGDIYKAGDTFVMGDTGVNLWAKWSRIMLTITYSLNGGSKGIAPAQVTVPYGDTFLVAGVEGTHKQLSSGEWQKGFRWDNSSAGNGDAYLPGNGVRVYSNLTLYLVFTKYNLRDTGPYGGVICRDYGVYREINMSDAYWNGRYVEVMKTDYSTGMAFLGEIIITINGVNWGTSLGYNLGSFLLSNLVPNLGASTYWEGGTNRGGGFLGIGTWKAYLYYPKEGSTNWLKDKSSSTLRGIRLGRVT